MKKKQLFITIPEPCQEDWNTMTPKDRGRHCDVCNKCVIDFTTFTGTELVNYFANKPQNVCGRFNDQQLNRNIYEMVPVPRRHGWAVAASLLFLATQSAFAQNGEGVKPRIEKVGKVAAPTQSKHTPDSAFTIQLRLGGVGLDTKLGFTHVISNTDQYVAADSNGVYHLQVFISDMESGVLGISRLVKENIVDTIYLSEVDVNRARTEIFEIMNNVMPTINITSQNKMYRHYSGVISVGILEIDISNKPATIFAPYPTNPMVNPPTSKDPNAKIQVKQSPKVEFGTPETPGVNPNPRGDR